MPTLLKSNNWISSNFQMPLTPVSSKLLNFEFSNERSSHAHQNTHHDLQQYFRRPCTGINRFEKVPDCSETFFDMLYKLTEYYCFFPFQGCKIYGFVGGLSGTASIMTLTSIALDRYSVILHPLNPMKKTTHRKALGMIMSIWLYAAFFSAFPLFGLNNYVSEGYLTTCSFDYLATDTSSRVFIFVFFLAAWLLPLLIISFSYASIFSVVFQAERLELLKDGRSSSKQSSKNR